MTDVATTHRRSMSPTRRLRIWEAHKGVCIICSLPIDGAREKWIVEHIRALALGGADEDANCGPAHASCADQKTHDQDMPAITKAKRQKLKALGIRKPVHPNFRKPAGSRYDWKTGRLVRDDAR